LQKDALTRAGCERILADHQSGSKAERPGLQAALDYARKGDTLVVWRLDRLSRSLKDLIEMVTQLESRGIGLKSLQESLDTSSSSGKLIFHIFGAPAGPIWDLVYKCLGEHVHQAASDREKS
jgi:DNA invertase Pin-like site-specific DNA recombinase